MGRRIFWERLICLAGLASAFTGWYALGEMRSAKGRLYYYHDDVSHIFDFALWGGLAAAIIGGLGWYLAARASAQSKRD